MLEQIVGFANSLPLWAWLRGVGVIFALVAIGAFVSKKWQLAWQLMTPVGFWVGLSFAVQWWMAPRLPDATQAMQSGPSSIQEVVGKSLVSFTPGPIQVVTIYSDPTLVTVFDIAGDKMRSIGRWMSKQPERLPPEGIDIVVETKLQDRFGNRENAPVLRARWTRDYIVKAQWDNLSASQVLHLSTPRLVHPALRDDLEKWCSRQQVNARTFCDGTP